MCCGAIAHRTQRRTTSIRPCTSRGARLCGRDRGAGGDAAPGRRGRRRSAGARRRRCPPPRDGDRVPGRALAIRAASCCPRTATTTGPRSAASELAELAAELAEELAALGCTDGDRPLSLPADASSFIGRDRELAELKALLRGTRLLTLAGTGGVGKTRLALELARAAERRTRAGRRSSSWPPSPTPHSSPTLIAAALDVRALSGQKLVDAVIEFVSRALDCCWCWTTASTCSRRHRAGRTCCCAPRHAHDPRDEPRAAARAG